MWSLSYKKLNEHSDNTSGFNVMLWTGQCVINERMPYHGNGNYQPTEG